MATVKRNPDQTRERILRAAAQEIHRSGFRGASLDRILSEAGVTKGALYHHFPNKQALGYAVLEEVYRHDLFDRWSVPGADSTNPVGALVDGIAQVRDTVTLEELVIGCPVNNLAQEMSGIDEGFRRRIDGTFEEVRERIRLQLALGQEQRQVAPDVDVAQSAAFILAAIEGGMGMGKNAHSVPMFQQCLDGVIQYIGSLKISTVDASA